MEWADAEKFTESIKLDGGAGLKDPMAGLSLFMS